MTEKITKLLFLTKAIQICPDKKPFFYTSGKIGPYYINTHYLYGSKESAESYLVEIQNHKRDLNSFPTLIYKEAKKQYDSNVIYKTAIDLVVKKITEKADYEFDYISGGERRDYFFSLLPAAILGKRHLSILKDQTVIQSDNQFKNSKSLNALEIDGAKVLHIADLITEASSYTRCWIPAIRQVGGSIEQSLSVIDRDQGGKRILSENGISLTSLVKIDRELFVYAKRKGMISENQYVMIVDFIENPDRFMFRFLKENPTYLEEQKALGGKVEERARLCESLFINKE
jgi:orotate phosphoribosyltransferase